MKRSSDFQPAAGGPTGVPIQIAEPDGHNRAAGRTACCVTWKRKAWLLSGATATKTRSLKNKKTVSHRWFRRPCQVFIVRLGESHVRTHIRPRLTPITARIRLPKPPKWITQS